VGATAAPVGHLPHIRQFLEVPRALQPLALRRLLHGQHLGAVREFRDKRVHARGVSCRVVPRLGRRRRHICGQRDQVLVDALQDTARLCPRRVGAPGRRAHRRKFPCHACAVRSRWGRTLAMML